MSNLMSHPIIDTVLAHHREQLGASFATYRNHCLRGLNYHASLLKTVPSDASALAWAVHDLGIWTAGTFDYLEPSAALVTGYAAEFGIADITLTQAMIMQHHRLNAVTEPAVDAFRRADRVDVTRGLWRGPISRRDVNDVVAALPYLGFHRFLAAGLTRHALTHPRRPLPMLRW